MRSTMFGSMFVSIVIVSALITKSALAADCQAPQAFVSGVQEYSTASTSGSPVLVHTGDTIRVRMYCADEGKAGRVSTASGFTQARTAPELVEKKGSFTSKLRSAYVEFEGTVKETVGDTPEWKFSAGGTDYTVNAKVVDGVARQTQIDHLDGKIDGVNAKVDANKKAGDEKDASQDVEIGKKADRTELASKADKTYVDEQDRKLVATRGGHVQIEGQPLVDARPGFDPAVGVQGRLGYHFGEVDKTGFVLALDAGGAQGSLPTRPVSNIPHTEGAVNESYLWAGPMALADVVAGSRASFQFGGGVIPTLVSYPGSSIGQGINGGDVWAVHPSNQATVVLRGNISFKVVIWGDRHEGITLGAGFMPGVELVQTKSTAGDEGGTNKVHLPAYVSLGGQI